MSQYKYKWSIFKWTDFHHKWTDFHQKLTDFHQNCQSIFNGNPISLLDLKSDNNAIQSRRWISIQTAPFDL